MTARLCRILYCISLFALLCAGCDPGNAKKAAPASNTGVWTCSMHPEIRSNTPGNCPKCNMPLVPVSTVSPAAEKRRKKYACSMFCIPPVDEPGKCPVCGMEMVEVDEGGDVTEGEAFVQTGIRLPISSRAAAQIVTAPVERRFPDREIHLVGKIDFDETRIGVISARVPGRLDKLFVDYAGISVSKGDHLVQLYSPDLLSAQQELLQAARGIKESEPIGIPALREAAEGNLKSTREKLMLWGLTPEQLDEIERRGAPSDHINIYASQSGVVIEKDAIEGMYVETGTKIYTIADLTQVWARLEAYETDLLWMRFGQTVEIEAQAFPGQKFLGVVSFIDPVVDERTRTIRLRANLDNSEGHLKPNMLIRGTLRARIAAGGKLMEPSMAGKWMCPMHPEVIQDQAGVCPECGMELRTTEELGFTTMDAPPAEPPLLIPITAPLITGRRAIVYVESSDDPSSFSLRQITLGPRAGDYYLVEEGLSEGEQVVANGTFFVDSAMQILGRASMMNPANGPDQPAPTDLGGH